MKYRYALRYVRWGWVVANYLHDFVCGRLRDCNKDEKLNLTIRGLSEIIK